MLPYCYGELNLKPWEIGKLCPAEVMDMIEGWKRRYNHLEDLFINWVAYTEYQINCGEKCPPIERFYEHRHRERVDHAAIAKRIAKEFNL